MKRPLRQTPTTVPRPRSLQGTSRAPAAPNIRRAAGSMSIGPIPRSPRARLRARRRASNYALTPSATPWLPCCNKPKPPSPIPGSAINSAWDCIRSSSICAHPRPAASNACSVGQTTSLTGSTITNFAQELASLLDNGGVGSANSTLGSGGTHFENALHSMNSFITSVGTGGSAANPLPYVFIITDGSQDYQTQSGGWRGGHKTGARTAACLTRIPQR